MAFDLLAALALPPDALIDRCVPKTLLLGNGAFAAGDRRRIQEGIEELRWLAVLKPLTVGIAGWHEALSPAGESTVVFLDSAFADDVAKTNLAETLKQRGLENLRSL